MLLQGGNRAIENDEDKEESIKGFLKEVIFQNTVFPGGERKQGKVEEVRQVSMAKEKFEQKLHCQSGIDPQVLKNKRFKAS